jgi:hypothetical protein
MLRQKDAHPGAGIASSDRHEGREVRLEPMCPLLVESEPPVPPRSAAPASATCRIGTVSSGQAGRVSSASPSIVDSSMGQGWRIPGVGNWLGRTNHRPSTLSVLAATGHHAGHHWADRGGRRQPPPLRTASSTEHRWLQRPADIATDTDSPASARGPRTRPRASTRHGSDGPRGAR